MFTLGEPGATYLSNMSTFNKFVRFSVASAIYYGVVKLIGSSMLFLRYPNYSESKFLFGGLLMCSTVFIGE